MRRLRLRLRALLRRRALDRDLEDELRFHLEMLSLERADAPRQFGNTARWKETCREMWTFASLELLLQDVRYALRTLSCNPSFTAVAVIALALGIGVNAAVFSLVNAILFKNLPFPGSEDVRYVTAAHRVDGSRGASYPAYAEIRAQSRSFRTLAAAGFCAGDLSDNSSFPQSYSCARLTSDAFSVLGLHPVAGRDFEPADALPGAPPVILLGHAVWLSRYAGNPAVVGSVVHLNGLPATIVGVMPPGITFPREAEIWTPLQPDADRTARDLNLFGKLAPGVSPSAARAEIETIGARLSSLYPQTDRDIGLLFQTFNEFSIRRKLRSVFLMLLGAVGLVLLIACANVANLLLGRAVARSREISIRAALGAGRWRLVRQLLVESVLLGLAGGLLGWPLAVWGSRAFDLAVIPTGKPAWIDFSLDYRVFFYLAAISIGAGILFGLAPALRLSRLDINSSLKQGGRGSNAGLRANSLSAFLVVVEMSLAVVLLAGAGLLLRGFVKVAAAPVGVNTANVLTMRLELPAARYPRPEDQIAFYRNLEERISRLPGIQSAAALSHLPADGSLSLPLPSGAPRVRLAGLTVGPDYFRVMQVRPLSGRVFTAAEGTAGAPVAVVNQAWVNRYSPGENPLGRRLLLASSSPLIIGVVPDIAQQNSDLLLLEPIVYLPYRQRPQPAMFVAARTTAPPATLAQTFRRAVQSLDPDLGVRQIVTLDTHIGIVRSFLAIFSTVFLVFAVIAFLLASVGLYAVVAHSVSRRTREIGVRVALGATARDVMRLILAHGLRQLAIGLAVGLAAAFSLTRLLGEILVGVSPRDPVTFASVTLVLSLAGLLGTAIPARRALRVDPVITLRHD